MQVSDFGEFFAALNGGHSPFQWQSRLLEQVVSTGNWPDLIDAPTGSGKSNVVDVHVFANVLFALGTGARVPRRMFVCVNRRALVDDHQDRATQIAIHLTDPESPDIVRRAAQALQSLVRRPDVHHPQSEVAGPPLLVESLRGGVTPGREWIADPRACAVVAATPDMWGSRLMFRGYGTTRRARPREAGLAAYDSVVVIDEAHLSRQLTHTASVVSAEERRFSELGVPRLQVVSTTATQGGQQNGLRIGVDKTDLDSDALLRKRLTSPKPVTLVEVSSMPEPGKKVPAAYIQQVADLADEARERQGESPRTVGCLVNNVATARALASELARRHGRDRVVVWTGRMRPMDLEDKRFQRPGLFSTQGDPDTSFLVATQTVEVGVDLDFGALVTELAPGSALTQRAGRVNRIGSRPSGSVTVIAPTAIRADRLPYAKADLVAGLEWIKRRARDPDGLSPMALALDPGPLESLARLALSTPHLTDFELLAHTSNELFQEPDLSFWLRDDLEVATDPVSIVLRSTLPPSDAFALEVLRATQVSADEMLPTVLVDARRIVQRALESEDCPQRCFRMTKDSDWELLASQDELRPGDTVVLDAAHPVTTFGVADPDAGHPEHDLITRWPSPSTSPEAEPRWVVIPEHTGTFGAEIAALVESDAHDPVAVNDQVSELVASQCGRQAQLEVMFGPTDEEVQWIVVRPRADLTADPEARQELSSSAHAPVPLEIHQANVGRLAERIGAELGLSPAVTSALRVAGQLHDEGKRDPRFQKRLGAAEVVLAKSGSAVEANQRRRARDDLPPGWRHEQLSVALATSQLHEEHKDLTLRLIGTSHGAGRPFFPHGHGLVEDGALGWAQVQQLFVDSCEWFEILGRTQHQFGVWGCAYLEAVLRSADCLVSGDGS